MDELAGDAVRGMQPGPPPRDTAPSPHTLPVCPCSPQAMASHLNGGFWLPAKQGSGKEALSLLYPIHRLYPSRHHHPPETVYFSHVFIFSWLHGESCKYCLLSLLKLRRNVNVVLVHLRLNSFERKTKYILHPVIKSSLQHG